MRSRVRQWILGAVWLSAAATPAGAQPPDEAPRVARLVEQLGDAGFKDREAAAEALAKLGPQAQVALEAALASDDVEVRIRARKLLELLAVEELWAGSIYQPIEGAQPALAHFEAIAAQSGNRLLLGERFPELKGGDVSLPAAILGFWPAMDQLCDQIDCRFRAHYELHSPGVAIVLGRRGRNPVAYSGPLRAHLASARRLFEEELDYARGEYEREHSFQIQMDLVWEDRFQLVAHRAQPVVLRAVTEAGEHVASEQPTGGAWNVVSDGSHHASATLRLHPPPVSAERLAELSVAWELIAVGELATIEIDPTDRATHYQDDAAVTIQSCRAERGGRVELKALIARDLPAIDPREAIVQENRLSILDSQGQAYRRQGQSHAVTPDGVQYGLTFAAPATDSTPALIRVKYPRIRSRRALELVFRDVPLPHARPE